MSKASTASADPGLLPTSQVDVNPPAPPTEETPNLYSSELAGHHDASYYVEWNRKRQEAIARGEDPNAEFIAKCKAREQQGYQGKIRRLFGRMKGSKSHGEALSPEEEAKAREKDGKGGDGVVR